MHTGESEARRGGLKAGFMNVNSLRAHIHRIRQFLHENQSYHLLGVTETRLDSSVPDDVIEVKGFKLLRQDINVNGVELPFILGITLKRQYFLNPILRSPEDLIFSNI